MLRVLPGPPSPALRPQSNGTPASRDRTHDVVDVAVERRGNVVEREHGVRRARLGGRPRHAEHDRRRLVLGDRKSTRLNSSHGYISYAVFCLKKKKRQKTTPTRVT